MTMSRSMAIIVRKRSECDGIKAVQKATILSQALPYIQKYNGKIVVIKYGGNAMKNETLKQNVMSDVVLLSESVLRSFWYMVVDLKSIICWIKPGKKAIL